MSNYKRLISYIYAYEGGVKGKNIGYAKLEVRGGQCRVQVSVKKIYVGSSEIGVYLLAPGAEVLLGRIFVRGGAGEFRMQVDTQNVEGSGLEIEDFYGLTIHAVDSTWQCYTTIWEDAVAQTAELQLAEVTAENARKRETEETSKETPEIKACEDVSAEPGEVQAEPPFLPISAEIEQELDEEEAQLETTAPWEADMAEAEELTAEAVETERQPVTAEAVPEMVEKPAPDIMGVDAETEAEENMETEAEVEAEAVTEPEFAAPQTLADSAIQDPAQLEELDRQEQEEAHRNNLWNRLERLYTKVLAFEYENDCQILSIKPQDIGLLPREVWMYGNNSFLLHGYYNYRHLILARLCSGQGGPRYLLGVPGHYFSNEKHMASMFGFPHFVLAKKQPDGDGRFGYWYTDIRL